MIPSDKQLIETDIRAYLKKHEQKDLLRFLTAGSVDDGKSTLIGRLLYDAKMIYEDQLAAVQKDSVTHGTTNTDFDPALLTDGLKAEREQGITIDVAYRYFSTDKRKFIIADTPGHEQYTRNMATGASTCDLAILLIDARLGVSQQTRRHSFIVSLLGIRHVIVAVNKMDLMDWSQQRYDEIKNDYINFAARLDIPDIHFIPISALLGDNVVERSVNMPWYQGSPLMHYLETVHIASDKNLVDLRFPVQMVLRPDLNFRGYVGTLASGIMRKGDRVQISPSGRQTRIKQILTYDGELAEAFAGMAVTVTLEDEVDLSRGEMICRPGNQPDVSHHVDAMVVWMAEQPMVPGKSYLLKQHARLVSGNVSTLRYAVDVNTLHRQSQPTLELNEVGRCQFTTTQPMIYDAYRKNRATGAFIIIDQMTNNTVGAGMMLDRTGRFSDREHWDDEPNVAEQADTAICVTDEQRQARFGQKPVTILLTGLTGSGKTTIAQSLERRLFEDGRAVVVLDGTKMRRGLSKDLGFSSEDRSENLRRAAAVGALMNHAGLICIAALIAPSESVRQRMRDQLGDQCLIVHLDCPIDVCRARAPEPWSKAEAGDYVEFPGLTLAYQAPESPDLVLNTAELTVNQSVDQLMAMLEEKRII